MGIIDDIRDIVMGWINTALNTARSYAYGLYVSVWSYASQISDDLWNETGLIWDRIGEIPVLTYETIIGWVQPLIDVVANALGTLTDVVDYVYDEVSDINSWLSNVDTWFLNKFNSMKDTVITWVTDMFENILDRVFEEGGT